jgi:hypothetical protein
MKHAERSQERLARSLQMLADIESGSTTPSRVETTVMARWDARQTKRGPSRARRAMRVATTMAAGITIIGALAWERYTAVRLPPSLVPSFGGPGKPDATPTPITPSTVRLKPDTTYTTVAVVGGPLMNDEPIRVVRMRVARSVLGELGIPSPSQRGKAQPETVDIEVLVGEDGVARGVRVPISEL